MKMCCEGFTVLFLIYTYGIVLILRPEVPAAMGCTGLEPVLKHCQSTLKRLCGHLQVCVFVRARMCV